MFFDGSFLYEIEDEQAKLPLNALSEDCLATLPGWTPEAAQQIILRRNQGGKISHLGELRGGDLPGFSLEFLGALESLVTVYSSGPVNLHTASSDVLTQLGFSPLFIQQVELYRLGPDGLPGTEDGGFFPDASAIQTILEEVSGPLLPEDQQLLAALTSSSTPLLGVASSTYRIKAEGRTLRHGVRRKIETVIEKSGLAPFPMVRGWHEKN